MARSRHPKKDVEQALQAIEDLGWTVTPKAPGHAWGTARCGDGCVMSIWSTPKSAQNHAKQILRRAQKCPH